MNSILRVSQVIIIALSIFLTQSCKKEEPKPPIIATTAVLGITQFTATAGGNITDDGGASVTARGVCWNTSANPTISLSTKTTDNTGTGIFTSSITELSPGTIYYVRAYATNSAGTSYGNEVSFTTSPATTPVLTTTSVTSITQNSATGGGNITDDGGASVTARGVCWNTSANPTISLSTKTTDNTGTGIFTSSITELSPGTIYYVRAYATNSAGTSYGNEVSFTTSPATTPVLTTTSVTSITQNSATGGGNITVDGGASVTARGVCWNTSLNPTISLSTKTTDNTGTGIFTSSITGLTIGTTYYVRAYATNSAGTSYGNEVSFTTSPATTPVLTTTSVTSITLNTATGGGNITDDGGASVTARGVCWDTSANPTISLSTKTTNNTGTGIFTSSITELSPGTIYYVRAYATNSAGTSYGNEVSFTTSPATTPVLTTTSVTSITLNTATGGGNITDDGGASVTARGVCWDTSANPTISLSTKTTNNTGTGIFTSSITELTPGTIYYVRAYATNSAGTSYGNEVSFTTSPATTPVLTTTSVTSITLNTATGGGNITDDGGASVTARGVCWNTSANPTISLSTKTTNNTGTGIFTSSITELTPGTIYYVRAYATNSAGTAYGNEVTFTTLAIANCGTVTDVDGNTYNTVTIGTQCWFRENLKTTTYRDGSAILGLTDNTAWGNSTTGSYCWYNNDHSTFKATYGAIYNFYTTIDNRNLCPTGWHVPTDAEWTSLTTYLGGESVAGAKLKESGTTHWSSSNASNETNFTALPGGYRNEYGMFWSNGSDGFWYSATENSTSSSWGRAMPGTNIYVTRGSYNKTKGFSIRCLQGEGQVLPTLTTTAASSIAQTTASVGGNVTNDGNSAILERGICYWASQNPTIGNYKIVAGGTIGSFICNITGLSGNTTYYVRAYATNGVGTSYGNEISFTTVLLPVLTTSALTNITQTSLTSGGDITSDGGAAITERGICYGTVTNPTTANSKVTSGIGSGIFTVNLIDLTAFTTYYIRAYAINSAGTAYGNEVIARSDNFVCSGQGWSGASSYDPLKTGIHPIIYYSNTLLPQQWQTSSPELVELIACELRTYNNVQTCLYTGGLTVFRYVIQVDVTIREAKTGNIVAIQTFYSNSPDACPPTTINSSSIFGTINYTEINTWLQNYVVK